MKGALLMMGQGDGSSPMEFVGEETKIRKGQWFCFGGVQRVILNLYDDKIENDILRSFRVYTTK